MVIELGVQESGDKMKDDKKFKYLSVLVKYVTIYSLKYTSNGNIKRTHDSKLYEYELVE